MSNGRVFITKKKSITLGHVCSCCKSAVLSSVLITASAQKTYSFLQGKAEDIAAETAEKAIHNEIGKIESRMTITHNPTSGDGMIKPGLFCEVSLSGFDVPCPNCRNLERWQSHKCGKLMHELSAENFPQVFMMPEDARTWALKEIGRQIYIRQELSKSEETVSDAKILFATARNTIPQLEMSRDAIPEIKARGALFEEVSQLRAQERALKTFDIKKKKELNEKIKSQSQELSRIEAIIRKAQTEIDDAITKNRIDMELAQAILYGCTGMALVVRDRGSTSYRVQPSEATPENFTSARACETEEEPANNIQEEDTVPPQEQEYDTTASMKIQFCRQCGMKLHEESRFCSYCGTKIAEE